MQEKKKEKMDKEKPEKDRIQVNRTSKGHKPVFKTFALL